MFKREILILRRKIVIQDIPLIEQLTFAIRIIQKLCNCVLGLHVQGLRWQLMKRNMLYLWKY